MLAVNETTLVVPLLLVARSGTGDGLTGAQCEELAQLSIPAALLPAFVANWRRACG